MMTVDEIINIDINRFNRLKKDELKKYVNQIAKVANKRIATFEKVSESSPAYRHMIESGGKISVKNKSLNSLRAEFVRARDFLNAETGSVRGWRKVKQKTINTLKKSGVKLKEENLNEFWDAYEKLKEIDKSVGNDVVKYAVFKNINQLIEKGLNADEVAANMTSRIEKIYERQAKRKIDTNGVSKFFKSK